MASGYRDDHEAAVQRADALERELARVRAELAKKEAALADATRQLAESQRETAEPPDDERRKAKEQLESLKRKREERHKKKRRDKERATKKRASTGQDSPWDARLLRLRSVVWGGEFWFSVFVLTPLVPVGVIAPRVASALAALILLLPVYGWIRLGMLERWARTRRYEIVGYPDLLSLTPPTGDEGRLRIELEFEGCTPPDLADILKGFDGELRGHGCVFSRPWPIIKEFSKYGTRRENAKTNWAVHRWIRRFEREVLRPLDAVSPLAKVRFDAMGLS